MDAAILGALREDRFLDPVPHWPLKYRFFHMIAPFFFLFPRVLRGVRASCPVDAYSIARLGRVCQALLLIFSKTFWNVSHN